MVEKDFKSAGLPDLVSLYGHGYRVGILTASLVSVAEKPAPIRAIAISDAGVQGNGQQLQPV